MRVAILLTAMLISGGAYADPFVSAYAASTPSAPPTLSLDASSVMMRGETFECRDKGQGRASCIFAKDGEFLVCDGIVPCHTFQDARSALTLYRLEG